MEQQRIELPRQAVRALEILNAEGFSAYAVGGGVRDALLSRTPSDWDIATAARPEQMKRCFANFHTVETGIRHGTLTVWIDDMPLEITTYRKDGEYRDHRHPVHVTFSDTIGEDLERRDFTVNAMAYHPREGLIDLFHGKQDLQDRVIRCVGDPRTRFCEDGLRILRALRFASVLNFTLDEETVQAVHECRELLGEIAAERIRTEFCKLLCGPGAVRMLRAYSDVLCVWIPELAPCIGFAQNSKYHCYDVYEHTLHALQEANSDLLVRISLLFHDIGKPHCYTEDENGGHFKGHAEISVKLTSEILKRLRFDNRTAERVTTLVRIHDCYDSADPKAVKRLMRLLSDEDILRLMEVKRCDRLAHAPEYRELSEALSEIPRMVLRLREADACLSLRSLAITGNDLLSIGIPKGKEIGVLLDRLLELVLDERIENDTDALLQAAKQIRESSHTKTL